MRYVMVDTTFDVVAPGAARKGVSQAGIDASSAIDYDRHHVSFVYVLLWRTLFPYE